MGTHGHLLTLSEIAHNLNCSDLNVDDVSDQGHSFFPDDVPWKKWKPSEYGEPGTSDFRISFLDDNSVPVSPWHNIPLYSENGLIHYMCITPKYSNIEYQIDQSQVIPQLKLAERNGSISNFSSLPSWNIGMLPQTLSDSKLRLGGKLIGLTNDGLPIRVIEIGSRMSSTGEICTLKPLCVISVTENNILSRVIIAIDVNDPLAPSVNDFEDVTKFIPGVFRDIQIWLETCYPIQGDEKRCILQLLEDRYVASAMEVIAEAHATWQLFADSQPEWLLGIQDYGRSIWRNYRIHQGISSVSVYDLPAREMKYDRAWFSSLDWDERPPVGANKEGMVGNKSWRRKRESRVADDSISSTKSVAESIDEIARESGRELGRDSVLDSCRGSPRTPASRSKKAPRSRSKSLTWCFPCMYSSPCR